ncbi:unnamed protein product (macronuclear) [Paramecium tetraurelia]|uniref:RRM domain-containing protein n=1 Tax=Paramecium tetraurelia TaxID=5888 RepID=A0BGL1_PARTE|nr:uncharacterized protein GSPATT00028713001 [Paramecium tetraurelia]CAK57678.1 unnamed protein product [Paramecium tetraurelia]|eukprot:XP_001425076.1 hypothetical protein (macronuclear) [Paramecium tetraurelia strain d4-2]
MYNNSRDPPNKILLLILNSLPSSFTLNNQFIHQKFNQFGDINKILIFEKGKTTKAFVEFHELNSAIQAKKQLNGCNIQGGKMNIHFSRLKNLNLEIVDNSRGTDYTQASSNSQNSDSMLNSRTEENIQFDLTNHISSTQSPRANSSPIRNEQINRLLESSDGEDDLKIWKQTMPLDIEEFHPEIQKLLQQRQSRLLKILNFDSKITAKMIYNVFSKFGNLEEILYEKSSSRAYIKYQSVNQAIIAKEYLNNIQFFDSQIRIYFEPLQSLQPTTFQDEYMIYYPESQPYNNTPLSPNLLITDVQDPSEISDQIQMFVKAKEIKYGVNSIHLTLFSNADALKIIAVFSDYEFQNQKMNIILKQ